MLYFLQIPELPVHLDSLDIKADTQKLIEHVATTPAEELLKELLSDMIQFGLKVLAALLIYCVGAWIIKKIKKILSNIFAKRHTEKAIASFTMSLVSITHYPVNNSDCRHSWSQHYLSCRPACRRRYGNRYGTQRNSSKFCGRNNAACFQTV